MVVVLVLVGSGILEAERSVVVIPRKAVGRRRMEQGFLSHFSCRGLFTFISLNLLLFNSDSIIFFLTNDGMLGRSKGSPIVRLAFHTYYILGLQKTRPGCP